MKKLILILIKLIPLYTLYRGVLGGKNRLGPILNIGKTIFTQYEIKKMMSTLVVHYQDSEGDLIRGRKLPGFLNQNFADEYSVQIRSLLGNDPDDLSVDIWQNNYIAKFDFDSENYILKSLGPDLEDGTKDDIEMAINIKGAGQYLRENFSQKNIVKKEVPDNDALQDEEPVNRNIEYDDYGYDSQGYDSEGFNEEGYNRNGFDRDGYNREGIHKDDLHLYQED